MGPLALLLSGKLEIIGWSFGKADNAEVGKYAFKNGDKTTTLTLAIASRTLQRPSNAFFISES